MFIFKPVSLSVDLSRVFVFNGGTIVGYNGVTTDITSDVIFPRAFSASCCAVLPNIFIFGGDSDSGFITSWIDRFQGTVYSRDTANLSVANEASTSSPIANTAFIFGGWRSRAPLAYYSLIERYTGTIRTTDSATLVSDLRFTSSNTISGVVYIFGGLVGGALISIDTIQTYNGTTRGTSSLTLPTPINRHTSSLIDGDAFIFSSASIQKFTVSTLSTESATLPSVAGRASSTLNSVAYIFRAGGGLSIMSYNKTVAITQASTLPVSGNSACAATLTGLSGIK